MDLSPENEVYLGGVAKSLIEEKSLPKVVKSAGRGFHGCMSPPAFNGIPVELLLAVFTADDGGRKDGTIEEELNGAGILPGCRG